MFSLYLFDLDGTLVDSLEDLADACNQVLAAAGLPTHPLERYRQFVGNGVSKLIERVLPASMRDAATVAAYKAQFDAFYAIHCMDKTRPYPGVTALLHELKQRGVKLAVLSNKSDAFVRQIADGIFGADLFSATCGQRDGIAKKPAPDGVYALLDELHASKSDALFIGDSNVDIHTAQNAGLKSVGVTWGFRGAEELANAGADFLIDQAEELLKFSE